MSSGPQKETVQEIIGNYHQHISSEPSEFAVIKIGGELVADDEQRKLVASDLKYISDVGLYPVIVHGGGVQIDEKLKELDIASSQETGNRVTSKEASLVIPSALAEVNASLVSEVRNTGAEALGIVEGVFQATLADEEDFGSADDVITNPLAVKGAIAEKSIPVVGCLGSLATSQKTGLELPGGSYQPVNINADKAAAAIALALGVKKYISLTTVGAVLTNQGEPIDSLTYAEAQKMQQTGQLNGGMKPKVDHACELIEMGVEHVVITSPAELLVELFTDKGSGTLIKSGAK